MNIIDRWAVRRAARITKCLPEETPGRLLRELTSQQLQVRVDGLAKDVKFLGLELMAIKQHLKIHVQWTPERFVVHEGAVATPGLVGSATTSTAR